MARVSIRVPFGASGIVFRFHREGHAPLDLNFCKEQFSAAYVRTLAAVCGLSVARPDPDLDSEDLILSGRLLNTRIRSPKLAVQLKCSSNLTKDGSNLAYALKVKNYDDLRPTNLAVPRILAVVEVPSGDDTQYWLHHREDRLCLLHAAYWLCLFGYDPVGNQTTITVKIPLTQRLTAPVLLEMIEKLGRGERRL